MTTIECSQCSKQYEDDILCCPHCGTASIPQLSKAQLRVEFMKASQGALAFIYLGLVVGLLAGGVYFVITLLNDTANLGSVLSVPASAIAGSATGFVLHRFLHREPPRKPVPRSGERP